MGIVSFDAVLPDRQKHILELGEITLNKIAENILLFLFKAFPLQKKVVCRSFDGHYSDSPKVISEKLHNERPDIKIVWLVDRSRLGKLPEYVKGVDINSISALYHLNTAAAFIDNNYGRKGIVITKDNTNTKVAKLLVWLSSRKKQVNLSTWHGTPMKKIGNDGLGSTGVDLITPPLLFIHPNLHTKVVLDRISFHRAKNIILGLPRNDILFDKKNKAAIKERLAIPKEKKVVLYAPTFRSDGYDTDNRNVQRSGLLQLQEFNFDILIEKLKNKFGDEEWVFVGRFHYFVEREIDWQQLEQKYPGKILNGNLHDDMSDYLAVTDVLITDCSSCMFDFAFTKRPVFLFFPDVDYYKDKERGFYFDINTLPFPCSKTFDELLLSIETFDIVTYIKAIEKMNQMLGAVDDGQASKRVVDFIISESSYLH